MIPQSMDRQAPGIAPAGPAGGHPAATFRSSPLWLLGVIGVSIFTIEILLMLVLSQVPPLPTIVESLLDAGLLLLCLFPVFYLALFRPLTAAMAECQHAELLARQRLAELSAANRQLQASHDELSRAQEQLLQSEKMASIGQLAAGIAHEINNPVAFVNSNLGTLESYVGHLLAIVDAHAEAAQPGGAEKLAAALQAADLDYLRSDVGDLLRESRDGLARVARIVQDVKKLSHPGESEFQYADLNACLETTLNVVWNELKYKADVIREFGTIPPVRCIADQIGQVAMNLLVNAAHAIEGRGQIAMRTRRHGDYVLFEVEDSGAGIAPEIHKRIFEPFYTTKPVGQGTGLGLAIALKIIQTHGGRIEVHSEPGIGSRFVVTLPEHGPEAPAATA